MDNEKQEMNQADITSLRYFYSKHISNLSDDQALTELFAQVQNKMTLRKLFGFVIFVVVLMISGWLMIFTLQCRSCFLGFTLNQNIVSLKQPRRVEDSKLET